MKKTLLLITTLFLFNQICFAQEISSSSDLIYKSKDLDKKVVVFKGEVIGDIMRRGGFAWINVHDGQNAIGVWAEKDLVKNINYTGDFKQAGDELEITGVFNRVCLEHGGDMDIHAREITKVRSGGINKQELDPDKVKILLGLLIALGLTWILSLLKRR